MAISAAMVKELRERTGAGMMECKQALTDADGDMDAAVEALRKKGAAKADKKAGRIAAEGAIGSARTEDGLAAVLVEVNCETDFVAKDANFMAFTRAVAETVLVQRPADLDSLNQLPLEGGGMTVDQARVELFSKIGENINIRRFVLLQAAAGERIDGYLHGSRIGVVVKLRGGEDQLGRDVAMHIAASRPLCIDKNAVPGDTLDKEREIFRSQAEESGKPAEIVEKIVEGKVQKFLNEITLLGQPFVKDPDQKVGNLLQSQEAEVVEFVRFEVGEGLEKRDDDFVAEVMAQAKGA
jgi:elongation factor Ts